MAGKEDRCDTCLAWDMDATAAPFGWCRARPPSIPDVGPHVTPLGEWPLTRANDWCMAHVQRVRDPALRTASPDTQGGGPSIDGY
jgi:hypothetical protein